MSGYEEGCGLYSREELGGCVSREEPFRDACIPETLPCSMPSLARRHFIPMPRPQQLTIRICKILTRTHTHIPQNHVSERNSHEYRRDK